MKIAQEESVRYQVLADGWIKDLTTGLEWGPSSTVSMTFKKAKAYCKKNGGRLPSRQELESIQDLTKCDPCVDTSIFTDTKSDYYWSSTPYVRLENAFWCVSFNFGYVYCYIEGLSFYVRPVRSSQ